MKNGLCFSRGHFRTTNFPVLCRPSLSLSLKLKKKRGGGAGAFRVHFISAPVDLSVSLLFSILNLQPSAGGNDLLLGLQARARAAVTTSFDPGAKRTLTKGRCPPQT